MPSRQGRKGLRLIAPKTQCCCLSYPFLLPALFYPAQSMYCEENRGSGRRALAPGAGFEPATNRLTAGCSTAELSGINALRAYRRAVLHASPVTGLIVRMTVIKQWSKMTGAPTPGDVRPSGFSPMIACRFRKLVAIGPSRVRDAARPDGLVAEWLRRGLQILVRGFDSLRGLHLSP